MQWFKQFFSRQKRYHDLSVSIQEHLEEKVDELIEGGMSRSEAEQTARRAFGNPMLLEERGREVWQWHTLESVLCDLKFALRRLRKSPVLSATILFTLAIGISANTIVFSVVNSILLRPLPYPDPDRLVALWLQAPGAGGLANFSDGLQLSASMYFTFSEQNRSFQSMGIWAPSYANVTGVAEPEELRTEMLSDGVLQTLNVPPVVGRWFSTEDQNPRGTKPAILSYGYWQRRFGGDRNVVGRTLQVDAQPRVIVGVMPRGFRIVDRDFDLLMPLALDHANQKLAGFGYYGIARLKPGVTLSQADTDIARLVPVWMDSWSNGPGTNPHYYETWRITPRFRALKDQVVGGVASVLWVVMATVALVMMIVCTNVANLLLVRAESRQQELSIRAALGAGRGRIARELISEGILLGALGGLLALGIGHFGLRLLVAIGPADLPRLGEVFLDARSLAFTLAVSVLAGTLFGSIPALKYMRRGTLAMAGTANRTASASRKRQRTRNALVVAQVAMALVLLVSAMLMIRTFAALRGVEPGFSDARHVQTLHIWIPEQLIADPRVVTRTQNNIADKVSEIPGVLSAGFAGAVPMENFDPNWDEIHVEGKKYEGGDPPLRLFNYVSPGYFRSMGTRLIAGRDFTWTDIYNLRSMVIVSENFARESWGSPSAAVGKRIRQFSNMPWQEVIGVVEDVRVHGVNEKAPAVVYWPAMLMNPYTPKPKIDGPNFVTFAVRSDRAGRDSFIKQVEQAVWSVNSNLPVASVLTMQQIYSQSMARTSFTLVMLAIAGVMALSLSLVGIYGVISYAVSQRTREIGIRLALGAQKSALQRMFICSALFLACIGATIGLVAAASLVRLMKSLLFGVGPLDPVTFIVVPILVAAASALASYLPARRAAAVDPVEALRAE